LGYINPGELFVKKVGPVESGNDVRRFAAFLREEAGLGIEPPIDLAKIYARFGMETPERIRLPNQQGLLVNPEMGLIIINEDDPGTRQRFTEAHELVELLFYALPTGKGWASRQAGNFKHNVKERLCNEVAAELLMPQASFARRVRNLGVSYQTARQLASDFEVSVTAALVQMARVGPGRHAVVLWRMKHKPTEIRGRVSQNQLPLFEDFPVQELPKKLRVEWTMNGPGVPYIPVDKSVPDDCSIQKTWLDGVFTVGEDYLDLGSIQGTFRCESKPFEIESERQVLSLLHLPGDAACGLT
jgi:hypothetical protein